VYPLKIRATKSSENTPLYTKHSVGTVNGRVTLFKEEGSLPDEQILISV